ncbi:2-aminoethylphosphonate ABC transporter substrate-binding protein [Amycolatopsis sp. PS_44_ISF1]|uniref:2-aminoethylphosphonate ABC transporter substrate-binding protein n=1 Tax=Amycolatopsis sp. PS_44_ISF1 TaxID=2974917 RepID=UPI0028DDA849|nr:2-aminoethylphosphonate ABC transporter substrate-binding protein [Amycolatopsis sp. PS_44_ISF1]MDT8914157.1 2-aminoethylphosphonate ABC transporter substrate-binding protein [Amycolatopsis sp. PS_44_ISF1]
MKTPKPVAFALAAGLLGLLAACGGTGGAAADGKTVTVYTVDGLEDWYAARFAEFRQQTGITVRVVTAGSGEVASRVEQEKAHTQADVLVTLPPFIQQAASQGVLAPSSPQGADQVPAAQKDPQGRYFAMMDNYVSFIYNPQQARPAPKTWDDLLDPKYRGRLQYSTPGEAGDGTAVLLQLQHVFGDQGALDYLGRLQANNVGPSSSTGKLQPKVAKGELLVANGDLQMNLAEIGKSGGFDVFFPADARGRRSTFAVPYEAGLVANAPHADNARELLDFLFSPATQARAADAFGLPARADVRATGANADRIKAAMSGVEVWSPDWAAVLGRLDADLAAYRKAVGR